jgi:hypothetical protein
VLKIKPLRDDEVFDKLVSAVQYAIDTDGYHWTFWKTGGGWGEVLRRYKPYKKKEGKSRLHSSLFCLFAYLFVCLFVLVCLIPSSRISLMEKSPLELQSLGLYMSVFGTCVAFWQGTLYNYHCNTCCDTEHLVAFTTCKGH